MPPPDYPIIGNGSTNLMEKYVNMDYIGRIVAGDDWFDQNSLTNSV